MAVKETRIEGPLPSGAAYAIIYENTDDGSTEIVEYRADDVVLRRTYGTMQNSGLADDIVATAPSTEGQ